MVQEKVEVRLKTGLQARPAALFVQEANRFTSDVFLEKNGKKVNAKSIMGLMSLAVSTGTEVTLIAEGEDEKEALEKLSAYVQEEV
ncbi:HPr family phosphocarrier protein [Bacillus sp. L381]|jgi:phosphotransferase system HPr (HPr) family protein|uniref:Catabolite repression HPr-like protein n=2 Tax=Bacillus amyloliquefaciens TaxID=1390 RepID=A0A9P1JK01_BACAS|nr:MULTISPECIES: HPr family phosphocarrier protein [Bacillus]AIW35317.1 phosphocarrier protein Chr [Bacillus subtilis]AEB25676.1 phosphocarrier protein Chr [Bacillus amyloliquefaciens TA208]AEB65138.1 catabolite repression HPr-like protein [Bacillus amyloliquefaciens LL3]AEK90712.1 phosphocarrier protein Chr [Bacillus amyloliquefaciens XH7]AOC92573.1 HPr-like protein Crh [Bacillus amyloliquefaciens]